MRLCASCPVVVLLTLLLCGQAFGKSKEPKKNDGKLDIPLPVNQDAKTLVIPVYNTDGKLQMNFEIGMARRIDAEQMRMSKATVETYGDDGQRDLRIVLPQSMFNLETRVVTSDGKVTIERTDFRLTGTGLNFNTQTRTGTLTGDIKMEIYDRSEEIE